MRARAVLLDTLNVLHGCMSDDALMDLVPGATDHNRCAAMLRQGLAVLTFTAIETFVRDRTTEALRSFNHSVVSFSDLSAALQKAATIGALEGIRFRLKFQEKADQVSWLVAQLPCIANVGTDIANLSDMSFGQQSSNIDEDDIRDVLAAFGVDNPWTNITALAGRVGVGGLLDCRQTFAGIRKRRHASAHAISSGVPHADLSDSLKAVLGISVAFDLLLSHCVSSHNARRIPGPRGVPKVTQADIGLIFVGPHHSRLGFSCIRKELLPPPAALTRRPIVRVFDDVEQAFSTAVSMAARKRQHVVRLGRASRPTNWQSW